jgi:hypothetical protein
MALPSSGAISLNNVNVELGLSGTAQISLNDAAVRGLFGVASGAISMSDGYGKSSQFAFTISSNQTNANLATLATNAGWDGTSKVVATIASGIYISSNSTGTPALTVSGSFPGGVELTNGGYIIGMGGAGGRGGQSFSNNGLPGSSGGLALSVSSAITITNNGTIGGGGGGGGGGPQTPGFVIGKTADYAGGGGGGGGRSSNAANSSGGAGGFMGGSYTGVSGGAGTVSAAGSGGNNGSGGNIDLAYCKGGNGGGWGSNGSAGTGAPGHGFTPGGGGSGGAATSGSATYITWAVTGTRYGTIG